MRKKGIPVFMILTLLVSMFASTPAKQVEAAPFEAYVMPYYTSATSGTSMTYMDDSLHLAYSYDQTNWTALNDNNGILFKKNTGYGASPSNGLQMRDPFILRKQDGTFVLLATNTTSAGATTSASIFAWDTTDLIHYTNERTLLLNSTSLAAKKPQAVYDSAAGNYVIYWTDGTNKYANTTADFITVSAQTVYGGSAYPVTSPDVTNKPTGAIAASAIAVSQSELNMVLASLGTPKIPTGTKEIAVSTTADQAPDLPAKADITYSDGATAQKTVKWEPIDSNAYSMPGTFTVTGTIPQSSISDVPVYSNPLIKNGADPDIYKGPDGYHYYTSSYMDASNNNVAANQYDRITLRRATTIQGLATAEEKQIFYKNTSGDASYHIWAPEIHNINGKWYVYFAAGKASATFDLRVYVIECLGSDPMNDAWGAPVKVAMNNESFDLDATVFEHNNEMYMAYAYKYAAGSVNSSIRIAKMTSPTTLDSNQVTISSPEFTWEQRKDNVEEAPSVMKKNGKIFMTFSVGSTDSTYAIGLLSAVDSPNTNLLDPASWIKTPYPVMATSAANGQFGPGHSTFTISEDGTREVLSYHARENQQYSGVNSYAPLYDASRWARVQYIYWHEDGSPYFGVPVADGYLPGESVKATVTVTAPNGYNYLDSYAYTINANTTHPTVLTAVDNNGNQHNVTALAAYTSSDPLVASVSSTGVVTGVNAGDAVITVQYLGKSYQVAVQVSTPLVQDDFEDGNYTSNPTWTVTSGTWSVGIDPTNASNKVLNQTDAGEGIISVGDTSWKDYTAVARFNTKAGGAYPGFYFRYQDTNNYYYFQMQLLNTLALSKKVAGTATTISTKSYTMTANTWYTLKTIVKGSSIKCYIINNGVETLVFDVTDTSLTQGKLALRNKWQAFSMDDVNVTTLAPAVPSNLTVTPSPSTTTLSWSAVAGATGYHIYRSSALNGTYTRIKSNATGTSYVDTGLASLSTYYYKISSINAGGELKLSDAVSSTTTVQTTNLSNLILTGKTSATASLSWDSVTGATGYKLYRATKADGAYTQVYSGTSTSFTDSGLTSGQAYYYVMTFMQNVDESKISNQAGVIASVPGGLSAWLDANAYTVQMTKTHTTTLTLFNNDGTTTNVSGQAVYTSSNSAVATVNASGVVTGVSEGSAIITIVYQSLTYQAAVNVVPDGMLLWYKMNEISGSKVADSSGNGLTGLLKGDATWLNGNGVKLDGSSGYVQMPNGIFNGLSSITVATDVFVDTASSNPAWVYTFGSSTDPLNDANAHYLSFLFEDSKPRYRSVITKTRYSNEQSATVSSVFPRGSWKHIAYTQTGTTGTLFVNGVQVAQNTALTYTPNDMETTIANYIGRPAYSADKYMNGKVKDFRVYSKALSASEILALAVKPDAYYVALDKESLQLGDTSAVTSNLVLPTAGEAGSVITWESSDVTTISPVGVVTRPAFYLADKVVTLTAHLTKATATDSKSFVVTVKKYPTDSDLLRADTQALRVYNIDDVRGNLTLPIVGANGSAVTWSSERSDMVTSTGEVKRPAHGNGDVTVKLTATLTLRDAVLTKAFAATVKEMPAVPDYQGYVFPYFAGEGYSNGEQIHFALSQGNDPLHWTELNGGNPSITSNLGEKGLRDPYIIRSPEGDKFYLIATDLKIYGNNDWTAAQKTGSLYIMVWESTDLVNWSEQRMVKVSPDLAGSTWAPEAFYDKTTGEYVVFWASKIFSDATKSDSPNQRIMYARTRDFYTFTDAKEYYNPGYSVIDTTMIEHNNKIYRFTKDERSYNAATAPNGKMVFEQVSDSIFGNYSLITEGIGKGSISVGEGPLVFKANGQNKWYMFIDFFSGGGYKPFETTDLNSGNWTLSTNYSLPSKPRHGTVLPVTISEYNQLSAKVPAVASANPGIKVTGVTLGNGDLAIAKGEEKQLTAIIAPIHAANQGVVWSSTDEQKVTVSNEGLLKGIRAGTATVTATTKDGGFIATFDVTVQEAPATGVTLNKLSATLSVGAADNLIATVNPVSATNKTVIFTVVGNAATVSSAVYDAATGTTHVIVTAVAGGTAVITATTADGGYTAQYVVTVNGPTGVPAQAILLNKETANLDIGAIDTLVATVVPLDATNKMVNFAITGSAATVSSAVYDTATGKTNVIITAIAAGTATITATTADGSYMAQYVVNVNGRPAVELTGIVLDAANYSLKLGELHSTAVKANYSDGTQVDVTHQATYETSNPSIVTVNVNGVVQAISSGTAIITVSFNGKTAVIQVTGYRNSDNDSPSTENGSGTITNPGTTPTKDPTTSTPTQPGTKPTNPTEPTETLAKKFTDISSHTWAETAIEALAKQGIINGMTDQTFEPGKNMTRADFVALLVRALGLKANVSSNFEDINQDDYFYEALGIAKELGIATGTGEGTFHPRKEISRQDMMVLVIRALKAAGKWQTGSTGSGLSSYTDSADISDYAVEAVTALIQEGIITGSAEGMINPQGMTTRAEVAVVVYRLMNKYEDKVQVKP
ncbi:family 43 glycosylhydrolase [Paenibacillus alba]|uniref:family 43 glycosylhydrolase n=1 Tax=Paenibacillus alba TaxID=1197127 RepID=UPI001567C06E|nr:family 43 glycosylhydrolase [Paenibacillus alba]NQX66961.1 family 43 glycosylhydrolase [Paenibacillus alba]